MAAKSTTASASKPASKPAPEATAPEVQLNHYVCVEPIKRDGKRLEPGAPIELPEDDPLIAAGAVREEES